MRNLKLFFSIIFVLTIQLIFAQVATYPHLVDPAKYPDYERRNFKAPTVSESFNDTVRFVGGRYTKPTKENMFYGNFYRPNQAWIHQSYLDLYRDVAKMLKEGIGAFDPAGYGPGTPYKSGGFGQKAISKNNLTTLQRLGPLFLGNSLGEQDGRYWADQRTLMEPFTRNPKKQHAIYLNYMRQNAKDYGYQLTQLTTRWGVHYTPKDGYVSMLGTECQNKDRVNQIQVDYAYNRGASKQYGLLIFGDVSVFNTWGHKGKEGDPYGGASYSLMRRMMLLQFQYNSWILGFENGWGTVAEPQPIGKIQIGIHTLVNEHLPAPGTLHVPVAFMTDFFSGYMPPYHNQYYVWGHLPYQKGNYLTHELLNVVYPDYHQNGAHKNEYAAISTNNYGDVDVLLSDAHQEVLQQYPLIVIADELRTDILEVRNKLNHYVQHGGDVILTAQNAKKILGTEHFDTPQTIGKNSTYTYKGNTHNETKSFILYNTTLVGNSIATINGKNAAIEVSHGAGTYTILLSDLGISNQSTPTLLAHTAHIIGDKMKQLQLFTTQGNVTSVTNMLNPNTYLVGIYNNSLQPEQFEIQSNIGAITSIKEYNIGEDLSQERGYNPIEGTVTLGENTDEAIRALDCRLFEIKIDNPNITQKAEITYPTLPQNKYLAMTGFARAEEQITQMPHFFHHFSGAKIAWNELANINPDAFEEQAKWLNHQKLDLIIDFTELFPLIDFRSENIIEYDQLNKQIASLKENMAAMEGKKTIVLPEANNELEQIALTQLTQLAQSIEETTLLTQSASKTLYKSNVIECPYAEWDSIYQYISARQQGIEIKHTPVATPKDKVLKTLPKNKNRYLALHDITDLQGYITAHQDDFFAHFGGVKIDGIYLYNLSQEATVQLGSWLQLRNMTLIVDMLGEINHYPDITWNKELQTYGQGKRMLADICQKMALIGSKNIIIGSHMRCEWWRESHSNESSIQTGISEFIKSVAEKGIIVHIQHREYQNYPGRLLASPAQAKQLASSFSNACFAANLGVVPDYNYLIQLAGDRLGLIVIAYKGDNMLDTRNPLCRKMYNNTSPSYTAANNRNVPLILDAEYQSWDEIIQDCQLMGW